MTHVRSINLPNRDIQILGVVVMMILGISLQILLHCYGFRQPYARWQELLQLGTNGAIILEIVTFLGGILMWNHSWQTVGIISYLLLLTI
ncbi:MULTISPECIES: hypothetical protein [Proteiniphilum]|uniref:hypothetical protein n=1 Tax=Proteiniphilum TaxID=294702 RepID=UPI001EE9F239|nr:MULTISPECIES: hypothetical protein [Proteiniphilum]ULB35888.1 hypothetical protein KDN43_07720 [Proteiniphilum propionicum]